LIRIGFSGRFLNTAVVFPSEKSAVLLLVIVVVKFAEVAFAVLVLVAFAVAIFEFAVVAFAVVVFAVEAAATGLVGKTASIGYGGRSYSESCCSMASFEGYNK